MKISMDENLSSEMSKEGIGKQTFLHPEGKFQARIVAIEWNEMKLIPKNFKNSFLYFHWRTEKGIVQDFCTLSRKASFQLANRIKACGCLCSNPNDVYYCGLVGRLATITIVHEQKEGNNGTYEVANISSFDYSEKKQETIDLSNNKFDSYPSIFKDYIIEEKKEYVSKQEDVFIEDDLPF